MALLHLQFFDINIIAQCPHHINIISLKGFIYISKKFTIKVYYIILLIYFVLEILVALAFFFGKIKMQAVRFSKPALHMAAAATSGNTREVECDYLHLIVSKLFYIIPVEMIDKA
ncbi:hypothetical protein ACJX0J_008266 [Zea mays]